MPNFKLLKDAYAIIGGIPQKAINLDEIQAKEGESLGCGTICCAAGWLGHHPKFRALGLGVEKGSGAPLLLDGKATYFADALAEVFDISDSDAEDLFCSSYNLADANSGFTHKQIWLKRVRDYLKSHGQLKGQLAAAKKAEAKARKVWEAVC